MTVEEHTAATPQDGPGDMTLAGSQAGSPGERPINTEPAHVEGEIEEPQKFDEDEKRWYEHGQDYVTFNEFRESPRGRDILQNQFDDEAAAEEELRKVFLEFETMEDHLQHGDRWALQEMHNEDKPWKLLTSFEKVQTVIVSFTKFCCIWGVLYLFIIALGLMGNAFKILGGKSSGKTFREAELISNPVAGLCIGILATVLMQSSSTTTSIVISMSAAGLVTVENAAYLVMGANIGTSVTNTIVSIAHLNSPSEYRRAFTGAVFHDMFNWLTVGMFLPLEASSGFLMELAAAAVDSMGLSDDDDSRSKTEFIKKITKPASGRVTSVDKGLIEKIAEAETSEEVANLEKKTIIKQKSGHVMRNSPVSDNDLGFMLLFVSLTMLTTCLLLLVKLLQSVLKGRVAVWTRFLLNIDFKNPYLKMCGGLDSYILLLFGTGCTILVQSSSVFTSTLTPLVGIGLIHIEKLTYLTHGANIGTTVTGVLSALSGDNVETGMKVALEHVFFNVLGTFVWFVIWPLRPVPIAMAKFMGETAAKLKWFPAVYILTCFVGVPVLVVGLAIPGWEVLVAVGVPLLLMVFALMAIVWVRRNRADVLPKGSFLRSEVMCGKEVPNFMKLWGGDLKEDMVDVEELQRKEKEQKDKENSVAPWDYSPAAWGLCILAFLGLVLALPTAQWRRVRYGKEPRGRKEAGWSFDEVCNDAFKKGLKLVAEPTYTCNVELLQGNCSAFLNDACENDDSWASSKKATDSEKAAYKRAFERCSRLGCRAEDWHQECPKLSKCQNRAHHAEFCDIPLEKYVFWKHTTKDKGSGKTRSEWSMLKTDEGYVPDLETFEDNLFANDPEDDDDPVKLKTYLLPPAALGKDVMGDESLVMDCPDCDKTCDIRRSEANEALSFCSDAPGLSGITIDPCTGELFAVTDRGPNGEKCPEEEVDGKTFAMPDFIPSMARMVVDVEYSHGEDAAMLKMVPTEGASAGWTTLKPKAPGSPVTLSGLSNKDGDDEMYKSYPNCLVNPNVNTSGVVEDPNLDREKTMAGIDLEEVHVLRSTQNEKGGLFIGCEEYGPKVLIWDAQGHIQAIMVPEGLNGTGAGKYNEENTGAPVFGVLPAIFAARRKNRGLESVATNTTHAVACMQSPLDGAGAPKDALPSNKEERKAQGYDKKALRGSNVVRCAMIDLTGWLDDSAKEPKLVMHKVVLMNAARAEYTKAVRGKASEQPTVKYSAAAWINEERILLLERAKASEENVGVVLMIADFSKGTNLLSPELEQYNPKELTSPEVTLNALQLENATRTVVEVEVDDDGDEKPIYGPVPNGAVVLAEMGVVPVPTRRFFDFNEEIESSGDKKKINSKLEGMFIANLHTLVLTEDNDFGLDNSGYSKIHVVTLNEDLVDVLGNDEKYDAAPKCPSSPSTKIEGQEKGVACQDMDTICPVGGLKGDMQVVRGLAITGAVLLGLGLVTLIAHVFVPYHPVLKFFIYAAAACLCLAWVFLLACWAYMKSLDDKEYGCYFEDESFRGGAVLIHGNLKYITMPSYSWAFCIFAWCMLTISLAFVLQRVVCPPKVSEPLPADDDEQVEVKEPANE